tara:strand:- start:207 stop:1115 length:909 start_codon:yes stop_codon:yes gene_type:complete
MNALVTGATGYIGRHLVKRLQKEGHTVSISNTKIANLDNEENLHVYNHLKFTYIFHLAAYTKISQEGTSLHGDQWTINTKINTNILSYWQKYQQQAKIVCLGTSASYSGATEMREENYLLGEPEDKFLSYALSKRGLLRGLRMIDRQYGLDWLYLIPSTVYGGQFDIDDDRYIYDFIRNCSTAHQENTPFTIWGNGEQERELIYIEDVIENIMMLLKNTKEVINIGTGSCYTINQIVKMVCRVIGYDYNKVERDENRHVGMPSKNIIIDKLLSKPEYQTTTQTSLEEGIRRSVDYYRAKIRV